MSVRLSDRCPVDPAHGPVLPVKDPGSRFGWLCPSQAHDGRLASHRDGPAPRTRALFTTAEVTAGQLAAPASRPAPTDSVGLGAGGDTSTLPEAPGASPAAEGLPPPSAATPLETAGRATG